MSSPFVSALELRQQGCFKLDALSVSLLQPSACISLSLWDLQVNASRDSTGLSISTVVNPSGILSRPSSSGAPGQIGICGSGDERPIVIKIMQTFGKGTYVQQRHPGVWTAHAVVAIYWAQANVLEYWNPSGRELEPDLGSRIPTILSSVVQPMVSNQTVPIRFIDTSPKGGSLDSGAELGYCESWIWLWVYARTVLFCNAQLIDAWLLSLEPIARTRLINEFWNSLNKGIAPETVSPLWQALCKRSTDLFS